MTTWLVLRTDESDSQNTFIAKDGLTEIQANDLVEEMTRRGHHQTYSAHSYEQGERKLLLARHRVTV